MEMVKNKLKDISLSNTKNFKPIGRVLYIEADKNKNKKVKSDKVDIIVDTVFKPYDTNTVTQEGIVRYLDEEKVQIDVKPGDYIYTHHFLCDEDNEATVNGETLYMQEEFNIYCRVREGDIEMYSDWNFFEPIEEPEENYKTPSGIYLKPKAEVQHKYGIARHVSKEVASWGVKPGDKIIFDEAAEYEIIVEGKKYFRIQDEYVYAKVE